MRYFIAVLKRGLAEPYFVEEIVDLGQAREKLQEAFQKYPADSGFSCHYGGASTLEEFIQTLRE